jgi:hypothetical protein
MDHVITIGDVIKWILYVGGGVCALLIVGYIVLVVLNPFSSGH